MPVINSRLLDCDGEPELTENFNRVLALIDSLRSDMTAAQGTISVTSESLDTLSESLDTLEALTTRTVTFDSDGGSAVDPQVVVYGGTAAEPEDPTKDELTFDSWYNGETVYDFATAVKADITLTAHWA